MIACQLQRLPQAEEKFSKGEVLPPSDASRCIPWVFAFVAPIKQRICTSPAQSKRLSLRLCRRPEPLPPAGPAAAPTPRLERTLLGESGILKQH